MVQLVHRCCICGRVQRPDRNVWLHRFIGTPGYGSAYDGETLYLYFCSECLDNMVKYDNKFDTDKIE